MADEIKDANAIPGMPISPEGGVLQVQRLSNPNRPIIYANNSLVVGTQWDIQMYFSLVHEVAPTKFGAVEEVMVVMTPEHAKAFVKAVQSNLERYEDAQGKIRDIKPVVAPNQKSPTVSRPKEVSEK